MAFPGILKRAELATGLLIKSICVNGDYLVVDSCDINQTQESDVKNYIQGGPAYAVFNIGAKKFEGSISFPLRVDRNNNIESAAETLLRHAAKPMQALRIDTNHVITHTIATVNDYATDNNRLISLLINLTTICYGYTKHKSLKAVTFLGIGIILTLVSHLLNKHNHDHFEFNLYNLFIILGGVSICFSNFLNHKLCTKCKKCSSNHD